MYPVHFFLDITRVIYYIIKSSKKRFFAVMANDGYALWLLQKHT